MQNHKKTQRILKNNKATNHNELKIAIPVTENTWTNHRSQRIKTDRHKSQETKKPNDTDQKIHITPIKGASIYFSKKKHPEDCYCWFPHTNKVCRLMIGGTSQSI